MSVTINIDDAQAQLRELIHRLAPGDEVIITENQQPVAKLVSEPSSPRAALRPPPGLGKGYITVVSKGRKWCQFSNPPPQATPDHSI